MKTKSILRKNIFKASLLLSSLFFCFLVFRFTRLGIIVSFAFLIVSRFLLSYFIKDSNDLNHTNLLIIVLSVLSTFAFLFFCAKHFVLTWSSSGIISRIASKINISSSLMLSGIATLLAFLSIIFVVFLFCFIFLKIKDLLQNKLIRIIVLGAITLVIMILFAYYIKNPVFNQCCLLAEGIFAIVCLSLLITYTMKKANISLKKFDLLVMVGMIVFTLIIYVIVISTRTSIYVWDYTTYYERMNYLSAKYSFSALGGALEWFYSGMENDYGCFLTLFIYPVFYFTNGTIQAFIISYYFTCVVPTMILLYCFAKWTFNKTINIEENYLLKIAVAVCISTLPLLHSASIQGMPDVFGLSFAGIIILLTLPYDFYNRDYKRWAVVFLITISIVLTRRWYIFLLIGYYISYFMVLIMRTILLKDKKRIIITIKNIVFFGFSCCILGLIVLDKMISMILNNNYSDSYSSWNTGGLPTEIPNQIQILGIAVSIVILFGWIFGLIKSKTRYYTLVFLLTNCISIISFTRIQNMGHHQSLILFYGYYFGIVLSISFLFSYRKVLCIIPAIAIALSFVNCRFYNSNNAIVDLTFSKLDLYPHQRTDTEGLNEINAFFENTLIEKERVQVLAASSEYDSEVFTHFPQPFSNQYYYRNNFLAPSGGFPVGFFDAKYILVVSPIQERTIVKKEYVLSTIIDEFYNNKTVRSHFDRIKTIPLQDDVEAIIYKRVTPVDNLEANAFITAFSDYCNQYPELFNDRISKYIE